MKNKKLAALVGGSTLLAAGSASAVDLTQVGTDGAAAVTTGAGYAVPIFSAMIVLGIIVVAFKRIAKRG